MLQQQQCQPSAKRLQKCSRSWRSNKRHLLQTDSVARKCNTEPFPSTKPQYKQCKTHFHTIFCDTSGFEVGFPYQEDPDTFILLVQQKLRSLRYNLNFTLCITWQLAQTDNTACKASSLPLPHMAEISIYIPDSLLFILLIVFSVLIPALQLLGMGVLSSSLVSH